jgi:hypothetical protein
VTNRQPKGVPVGGQFAEDRKPEGTDLTDPETPKIEWVKLSSGTVWDGGRVNGLLVSIRKREIKSSLRSESGYAYVVWIGGKVVGHRSSLMDAKKLAEYEASRRVKAPEPGPKINPREDVSATDTAKMVRAALKENFPEVTFSVTTEKYTGGAAIKVRLNQELTDDEVHEVTKYFDESESDPDASLDDIMNGSGGYRTVQRYRTEEDGSLTPLHFRITGGVDVYGARWERA